MASDAGKVKEYWALLQLRAALAPRHAASPHFLNFTRLLMKVPALCVHHVAAGCLGFLSLWDPCPLPNAALCLQLCFSCSLQCAVVAVSASDMFHCCYQRCLWDLLLATSTRVVHPLVMHILLDATLA